VTYLLDVNALLALGHTAHLHHGRVAAWVAALTHDDVLATCSITEIGFVRIAPQARLSPGVQASRELLAQLRGSARPPFVRLSDDLGADSLPEWVDSPGATTDAHLTALAEGRSSCLATLDEGIPGSLLIPS
jgi:predicted nucleic acid-binding protein